jgi:hypothetical protein
MTHLFLRHVACLSDLGIYGTFLRVGDEVGVEGVVYVLSLLQVVWCK